MDNFISILRDANSPEELETYKVQLFKENVRLRTDRSEIEELQDQNRVAKKKLEEEKLAIAAEREQLELDKKDILKQLENERRRLEEDTLFFQKKQIVLERAFKQLDADRRRLESERQQFIRDKEARRNYSDSGSAGRGRPLEYRQGIFFKGITNQLALKKRYKELIKIFHPDNISGDNDTLQQINREYEILKHDLNLDKKSW